MTDKDPAFDVDLEMALDDDFDPLAGPDFEAEDIDFPVADANDGEGSAPHVAPVPDHDERPADVRLAELFDEMVNRRKTLLAILDYCREAQPVREVADYIGELKLRDKSVFSANDFTSLLQRAGGLERVGEDGEKYVEVELEPKTVVVDGVEYLEPQTPPPAFWRTTQAGAAFVDADDPDARLQQVFEEESTYLPIYRRILTLCHVTGGADARRIAKEVDSDPMLQNPRYYSSRFVEKLKLNDALVWQDKTWVVTDLGLMALDQLKDVEDVASDKLEQSSCE